MRFWIEIVCFNATSAVFLAAAAWFVSRRVQRPALAHTLWLLVLLRLVAPPLLPIERVPRMSWLAARLAGATEPSAAPAPMAILPAAPSTGWLPPSFDTAVTSPTEHEPGASARRATAATASRRSGGAEDGLRSRFVAVVIGIGIVGAFILMSLTLLRARRFRRHLQHAPEASQELQARVGELARLLGVRRLPKIRIVPQHIPPSLWPRVRGCEILLPAALLPHLTADERDLLIAHELAHVRRHDPWIRPVEQAIVALYWWHPLAWWARRHLRAEEEKSCDAVVVAKLPHLARAYAEAVLKTLEFLAVKRSAVPEFATGAGGFMRLEERMKSILSANAPRPASMRLRLSLLLPAVLAVLVAPSWVQNADGVGASAVSQQQVGDSMQQHREELRLRQEMHALETRRMQIQMQIEEIMMQREQERMRAELQRLEQEGATEEAAALRRHLAETEAEAELRREQMRFESAYTQKREVLEFELQDLMIQRDELSRRGGEAKAQELDVRVEEIARQLKALELDAMRAEIERSRKQLDRTTRELEVLSKP